MIKMKKLQQAISLIAITALMGGCSFMPDRVKPVEVVSIQERPPMYHPPLPLEMQLVDVTFKVLTPDLMSEYLASVAKNEAPAQPYYALTTQQYTNLSLNMSHIKRYTTNMLQIIKFYRDYDKEEKVENTQDSGQN